MIACDCIHALPLLSILDFSLTRVGAVGILECQCVQDVASRAARNRSNLYPHSQCLRWLCSSSTLVPSTWGKIWTDFAISGIQRKCWNRCSNSILRDWDSDCQVEVLRDSCTHLNSVFSVLLIVSLETRSFHSIHPKLTPQEYGYDIA